MKVIHTLKLLLLNLTGHLWQDLAAAAHNIISDRNLCQHQWQGSKIIGCGGTGCAFDVYSEEGVRGVKKVYYANSSVRSKTGDVIDHPLMMHRPDVDALTHVLLPLECPRIFKSAAESLQLLDGECSVAPALDVCDGDNGYIPYIVYVWKGTTTIQSYYLDAKRPIPGLLLLSWFEHAMEYVAPCVANHGLVVFDIYAKHALIDPTGELIPENKFVLIDADGYSPSHWWITGAAKTEMNINAALLNRILFADQLFFEI